MKRYLIAAVATAALALSACETATPYQPLRTGGVSSGGYSERQLEQNRWMVSFSGNSLTDRRTVETYMLYHAAELTLAQGFDWFSVVDRHTDRSSQIIGDPDPFYSSWGGGWWGPSWRVYRRGGWGPWGGWGRWGGWGAGWGPDYDLREVTRYEANAEIFMGRGPKPANDRRAFDAHQVVDRLSGQIVRPKV